MAHSLCTRAAIALGAHLHNTKTAFVVRLAQKGQRVTKTAAQKVLEMKARKVLPA